MSHCSHCGEVLGPQDHHTNLSAKIDALKDAVLMLCDAMEHENDHKATTHYANPVYETRT